MLVIKSFDAKYLNFFFLPRVFEDGFEKQESEIDSEIFPFCSGHTMGMYDHSIIKNVSVLRPSFFIELPSVFGTAPSRLQSVY